MTRLPPGRVFHLVAAADPTARLDSPTVANDQFERHGFVHCCFREQLTEIASWWFDADDDLVALELDPTRLTHELRLEPSPTRWFPHLYGPIDADAVVAAHHLPALADRTVLPPALAQPLPGYQLTGQVDGQSSTVRWWLPGRIEGDTRWTDKAEAAIADGLTVELFGGIVAPATLDRAQESFSLLASVADDGRIDRYDGDGYF